jgi:hypothetical protein
MSHDSTFDMLTELAEFAQRMSRSPKRGVFIMLNTTRNIGGRTRHAPKFVTVESLKELMPLVWERVKESVNTVLHPEKEAVLYVECQTHKRGLSRWKSGCINLSTDAPTANPEPNTEVTSLRLCANILCNTEGSDIVRFKCGACRAIYYCSMNCQKMDWKNEHKDLCEKLKKQRRCERNLALAATTIDSGNP